MFEERPDDIRKLFCMPQRPTKPTSVHSEQMLFEFDRDPLQMMSVDEIYDKADEVLLAKLGEDRRLERKACRFGGSRIGEYFSMWANTQGGGLIVLGQSDDGQFEGCRELSDEALNEKEKSGSVFTPDARIDVRRVSVTNKKGQSDFVLLFRVKYHRDIVVRTTAGKAFVRKGQDCIELKPDEIREIQADKGEISFEQQDAAYAWPSDFDTNAVSQFVGAVRTARGLSQNLTSEEILNVRHLGTMTNGIFKPNVACALLFAKDPLRTIPGCKIRFQRFEGTQEGTGEAYNAVKDLVLEGTVPQLVGQLETLLESQLRTFSPLDAAVKFFPVPEYPKPAWYEAVVNACVHRTYGNGMRNMPIFVKMFDDRLIIESPGPFPPFVNSSNIYESHHPRNPKLMDAMFYLDYVKCAHEGTRRIRDTMAGMKLPAPEFRQDEHGPAIVRVTLRNNVNQRRAWIDRDVSKIVSAAIAADLSDDERRALNLAAENGTITVSDANKLLDISWARARRLLLGLAKKRVFQYVRFKPFEKDKRDPNAFFRLRSADQLPEGAFEPKELDIEDE